MSDEMVEVRNVMHEIIQMIRDGDVPRELSELCKRMEVEKFAFWLYGFITATTRRKAIRESELCRFLRKEIIRRL